MRSRSYILDLLIKEGTFENRNDIDSAMWFVISADGIAHPFSTNQVASSNNPCWTFPSRMFIQTPDIQRSYLYLTLCTYSPDGQGVVAVARSKIALRLLPAGNARQFTVPLMGATNSAKVVMQLKVVATISMVVPASNPDPSNLHLSSPIVNNYSVMQSPHLSHP